MFDTTHETNIESKPPTPDAATKEPPVRVDVAGRLAWIRPSNVLRIEVRPAYIGFPDRVIVVLSDNNELIYDGKADVADAIAALLWPKSCPDDAPSPE